MADDPRSMRGRIGAHYLHATRDPRDTTARARAAFRDSFETAVDPDHVLPADERTRRAMHLMRAYYTQLAYRSAAARRARKGEPQ